MLKDPQLFLLALLVSCSVFWALPPNRPRLRQCFVSAASMVFVFIYAPFAICIVGYCILLPYLTAKLWVRGHGNFFTAMVACLLALCPLILFRIWGFEFAFIVGLGLAFTTLRSIGMIVQTYQSKSEIPLTDAVLLMTFFPTFSSGPIENLSAFTASNMPARLCFEDLVVGATRIAVGIFKATFIAAVILEPNLQAQSSYIFSEKSQSVLAVFGFSILSLAFVYVNFSSYSDIAVGAGRLFGFRIIENFNFPFLATNIIDFWQRWHISLGRWVTNQIYLPILRNYGFVYAPIFVSFVFVGIWHAFTWNYLIWGASHGIALAATQYFKRLQRPRSGATNVGKEVPFGIISWASVKLTFGWGITMFFVSVMSVFANANSLENGLLFLKKLTGLQGGP